MDILLLEILSSLVIVAFLSIINIILSLMFINRQVCILSIIIIILSNILLVPMGLLMAVLTLTSPSPNMYYSALILLSFLGLPNIAFTVVIGFSLFLTKPKI